MSNKEYFLFNILFVALLFCLFFTAFIAEGSVTIPSCQILALTGKECESCGLTRDFISYVHLDFGSSINRHSLHVFAWFCFQFTGRLIISSLPFSISSKLKWFDFVISVVSGILVFVPFWL